MPVFTSMAAAIAAYAGVTSTLAIAAINFGIRLIATMIITSLIMKKQGNQSGASSAGIRVQVPPATTNKLPVTYGDAYLQPTTIDAKISTDQQYMWYVLAYSEVTDSGTISFEDPNNAGYPLAFWEDRQMKFDPVDRTKVIALIDKTTDTPVEDTSVNGKMNIWFYTDGSNNPQFSTIPAYNVLSDATTGGGIPVDQRWTSSDAMTKTAFAIVRIKYDQNAQLYGIKAVTARLSNSLNKPGSVIVDYLQNTRYGCAVPASMIDTAAFTGANGLDSYSDEVITYKLDGTTYTQPRYRINGPVNTTNSCMSNLLDLAEACDSWLQWNESLGKWSVVINRSLSQAGKSIDDLFTVYSDRPDSDSTSDLATYHGFVVGGINITPVDLNATYNAVEVQFPNYLIKDQVDYAYINLPTSMFNPNEPANSLTIQLPQVNNSVQAQYLGTRRLEASRDDLVISFTIDYSGMQIDAGDVIRVYHKQYGWTQSNGFTNGKLFRVTQVQESKDEEGVLSALITATEYNDTIYGNKDITAFKEAKNTGITNPNVFSDPLAPTILNVNATSAIPSFDLRFKTPSVGNTVKMEIWYALAATGSPPTQTSAFTLYGSQSYNSGPIYPNNAFQTVTITGMPASPSGFSYFWRVRAAGTQAKSNYSDNSSAQSWAPNPTATVTGQNFQTVFQPSPITVARFSNGAADLANVSIRLYGVTGPGQVNFNDTQSNVTLGVSEWRIDNANIVATGITIGTPTDGGTYAQWPAPTAMSANVATLTVPVIYKDSTGNVYAAPPSIVNINKTIPGETGSRGVVSLAYVPVSYDPTTASDATLSSSFYTITGFNPPITNDGAIFFNETTNIASSRVYNSTTTPLWQPATLQIPGSALTDHSVSGSQIANATIATVNLQNNSVTSSIIADGAVGSTEIANAAVIGTKIADLAVSETKIAANAISTAKIQLAAVTSAILADQAVLTSKLANAAVTTAQIANDAITTALIAANAVTVTEIADNSISTPKLIAGSIVGSKIAADTITATNIAAGTITGNEIAANSIYGNRLVANSISANEIAANAITGNKILANTITGLNIAANTIAASKLVMTDLTGIVENGAFLSGTSDGWSTLPTGWAVGTLSGAPTQHVMSIVTTISGGTYASEKYYDTSAGEQFTMTMMAQASAAVSTNTFRVLFYWLLNTGAVTSTTIWINPTTTWTEYNSIVTAPANATGVRIRVFRDTNTDTSTIRFTQIQARRRNAAQLIVDGSIVASQIAAGTITAAQIATGTITAAQIATGTITANEIATGTITAAKIATGTITATQLAAGSVTASELAANCITVGSAAITTGAITTAKIGDLAVDTIKIADQAVTIPTSAYTNTSVSCVANANTLIQSVTWTSEGAPTLITSSVVMAWPGSSTCTFYVKNAAGTVLWQGTTGSDFVTSLFVSFNFTTTPGAGTQTLSLYANPTYVMSASRRNLAALEVKK